MTYFLGQMFGVLLSSLSQEVCSAWRWEYWTLFGVIHLNSMWMRKEHTNTIHSNPGRILLCHLQYDSKKKMSHPLAQRQVFLAILAPCVPPLWFRWKLDVFQQISFHLFGGFPRRSLCLPEVTWWVSLSYLGQGSLRPQHSLRPLCSNSSEAPSNSQERRYHFTWVPLAHLGLPLNSGVPPPSANLELRWLPSLFWQGPF